MEREIAAEEGRESEAVEGKTSAGAPAVPGAATGGEADLVAE